MQSIRKEVYIMDVLRIILTVVMLVAAVVLITVVLMQQTKSSGLGGAFGGDSQSFTARGKAASREAKLQKITVITAIVMGVLAIAIMIVTTIAANAGDPETETEALAAVQSFLMNM